VLIHDVTPNTIQVKLNIFYDEFAFAAFR